MADPAAEIQVMRAALEEATLALLRYDIEDVDLAKGEEAVITITAEDQKTLRTALVTLKPLINP